PGWDGGWRKCSRWRMRNASNCCRWMIRTCGSTPCLHCCRTPPTPASAPGLALKVGPYPEYRDAAVGMGLADLRECGQCRLNCFQSRTVVLRRTPQHCGIQRLGDDEGLGG